MPDIIFEEIACKRAITRIAAPNLPFRWTLNPYRGRQHACTYCFARASHRHLGYDAGRDFESRIVVKVNAPDALRADLARPGWRRELIGLGTACDPYQPAELKYSLTHRLLRVLRDFANPASIVTKSPLVVRDADLLEELAAAAALTVAFSIATLDEEVWKRTEPATAKPSQRLEAMAALARRGVRCGVLLAPVLPGLSDAPEALEGVVAAARDHGASFIAENVLFLKPGTREWFMPSLREAYPHLAERYAAYYRGPYAPRNYTAEVHRVVARLRERYRLGLPDAGAPAAGQMQLAM